MKININGIQDDLEGDWWLHLHSSNFGFQRSISNLPNHEVKEGDILIHKQIKEGERFPTIRYHKITDKGTNIIDNKEVKELLIINLVDYIRKNKRLPYACTVAKFFKNGAAQVNYKPTEYDNFALKIIPEEHGVNKLEEFLKDLLSSENPIKPEKSKIADVLEKQWKIRSSSDPNKKYIVKYTEEGSWSCSCPQFTFRRLECKHIKECKKKL
ncbi:MAG: hypothetical protein ACFFBY_06230 [Promethearchaeota archaeon]